MVNFDEFDTEEHPRNLREYLRDFLMSPKTNDLQPFIIKLCRSNIIKISDILNNIGANWANGDNIRPENLMPYKFISLHKRNYIQYINSINYLKKTYNGHFYYDMCDNETKQIK